MGSGLWQLARFAAIVAFGMRALPPTWSKWKCELMTRSMRAGSRLIASSRALTSSPRRKWILNKGAV